MTASATLPPAAPSGVSPARIEAALGNPSPAPLPPLFESRVEVDNGVPFSFRSRCDADKPGLSSAIFLEIGDPCGIIINFILRPEQAEALSARLLEHAEFTRRATDWVSTEAKK